MPGSKPHASYSPWSQGQHQAVGHFWGLPANSIFSSFQTTAWIDADVTLGRSTEALESPLVPDFAGKDAELRSQVNIKPALSCLSPCPPSPP